MNPPRDDHAERQPPFQRNPELDRLLALLEEPLRAAEERLLETLPVERRPIVLICACARTGATLLLQLLANSGAFAYPSNLLSRFYAAPVFGALIQRLMFDPAFRFRDEVSLQPEPPSYGSDLGKTEGPLSPHDFYHFWRRWFAEIDGRPPGIEDVRQRDMDFDEIRTELRGLVAAFEQPLAMKASLLNWTLPVIADEIPETFVVFLRRDPLFTAQSLLEARRRFFGSSDGWYSFEPPEIDALRQLPATSQVAAQVRLTEKAIEDGLRGIEPSRVVRISYEDLCANPGGVWRQLADVLASHPGCPDLGDPPRTTPFESANTRRLSADELDAIQSALDGFAP